MFTVTYIHMLTHQNPNINIQLHHPTSPNTQTHIHISRIRTHAHTNTSCTYTFTSIVTHIFTTQLHKYSDTATSAATGLHEQLHALMDSAARVRVQSHRAQRHTARCSLTPTPPQWPRPQACLSFLSETVLHHPCPQGGLVGREQWTHVVILRL